ncbi:hypothetical protein FQZ97_743040 [compost metagenome]
MRGISGYSVQRALNNLSNLRVGNRSRSTCTILICQTFNAILSKPAAPLTNCMFVNTQAFSNVLAVQTLSAL